MSLKKKRSDSISSSQDVKKRLRSDTQGTSGPSDSAVIRETITLPSKVVVSKTTTEIMDVLEAFATKDENMDQPECPVIIGSRAAMFWLPSFRPFDDWDLIATPQQAYNIVKDLQAYDKKKDSPLSITLIRQPLDGTVIKRKPITPKLQETINHLPTCLYKVYGQLKDELKFEIEIAPLCGQADDDEPKGKDTGSASKIYSATCLLQLCNSNEMQEKAYLHFPVGFKGDHKCIVASIEILEALKSSHIYWPIYFAKNITDLHTFRAVMAPTITKSLSEAATSTSSHANPSFRVDKNTPMSPPKRSSKVEDMIFTRSLEVEAFRGTPGAHINLNMSNEDFLGRDDDLSVTRHVPHDDIHAMVKYGAKPIFDEIKSDKSKAMISKELFEKVSYDKQLKCVKEEAMVIALERFLLPKLSVDPSSAYTSALSRICTTLTKGWFRQFAIDNYPRLSVCDEELLSIRDHILEKHPLPPKVKGDTMDTLRKTITNLEDLANLQTLIPLTKSVSFSDVVKRVDRLKQSTHSENDGEKGVDNDGEKGADNDGGKSDEKVADNNSDNDGEKSDDNNSDNDGEKSEDNNSNSDGEKSEDNNSNSDDDYGADNDDGCDDESDFEIDESENDEYYKNNPSINKELDHNFWIIEKCTENGSSIMISFINESIYNGDDCIPYSKYHATLSVQTLDSSTDLNHLRAYKWCFSRYSGDTRTAHPSQKISAHLTDFYSEGSWGTSFFTTKDRTTRNPLKNEVERFGLQGLTEELLMHYIIALVQPKLHSNGETPLMNAINKAKAEGSIPFTPKNHLWFDIWRYGPNR